MTGTVHVVVGGQYGSEAKGHVAAQLAARRSADFAIRVGGPNAGHTVYDLNGVRFAFRSLPVAAVMPGCEETRLVIAAGSEIEVAVLEAEIDLAESHGHEVRSRLWVDAQATILSESHHRVEADGGFREAFGSTAKGVGAARADRLLRSAQLASEVDALQWYISDTSSVLRHQLAYQGATAVIEGTQGYGLGLHAGFYPYCTSGNCRAVDFLAQTGIHPNEHIEVQTWVVFRTYPIRVAGNSGALMGETNWETLAALSGGYIQPEKTTVTQLVRRVGQWDPFLAEEAMGANGAPSDHTRAVLMFADYLDPELAGVTDVARVYSSPAWARIQEMASDLSDDRFGNPASFAGFGTGPQTIAWAV